MSNPNHYPAGAPDSKGGEFAPKEGGNGGDPLSQSKQWDKLALHGVTPRTASDMKPKRAHRATGNPRGRPPGPSKEEKAYKAAYQSAAATKGATYIEKPAHIPEPPHPAQTVPQIDPYKGLTGDKHTDRQLLGVAGAAAGTLLTGAAAVGVGYGVRKIQEKLNIAASDNISNAVRVMSNGVDARTGSYIYDGTTGQRQEVKRGPGRPPGSGVKPPPAIKLNIGLTTYRKPVGFESAAKTPGVFSALADRIRKKKT
jgi:hypothetical protein